MRNKNNKTTYGSISEMTEANGIRKRLTRDRLVANPDADRSLSHRL